jgi:hypothetical protein
MPVASYALSADGIASVPGATATRERARHPVTLICVNAEGMEGAHAELGEDWFLGRYTIGLWWWEVDVFPARWERAFDFVDEIWVGSQYVAGVLAPHAPVPVVRMPMPVFLPPAATDVRGALGLPDGPLFLTAFDYGGVLERKNPLAVIEAFRQAFEPAEQAALVLKCAGADRYPAEHTRLLEAAGRDGRIAVVEDVLSDEQMAALLASCDCYVSLHRSEGFGFPIAEAMLLGKPVVATAHGGPAEYLSERTGFPVRYELAMIGDGNEPYPADGTWAAPDTRHAAELMRHVLEHPNDAAQRARRAREHMERDHSKDAAGKAMADRVTRVAGLPTGADGKAADIPMDELLRRIRAAPDSSRSPRGLRALARRAALRLVRPQAVHQREIDEELARAVRTLDERLRGLASSNASLLAEVAELRAQLREHGGLGQ